MTKTNIPSIRFKGFSGEWEDKKLGEVSIETHGGGTPRTDVEKYWDGTTPWIQSSDLVAGNVLCVKPKKHISDEALAKSATKLISGNSIAIVSRVGVGKLSVVSFPYATSQDFLSLSRLKIDLYFGVYSIYKKIQNELSLIQGTSIKGITKEELLSKIIQVPQKNAEQSKIGSLFSQLDTLITQRQRKYDKLVTIKKAMLEKMFPQQSESVPAIRFKGFSGEWEKDKLGSLCHIGDIDHRMPQTMNDGIPYLMTGDFIGINELDFENAKLISQEDYEQLSKKIKPELGDILFARYASVGAVRYVDTDKNFLISYSCAIIKRNAFIEGQYLYYSLQSSTVQKKVEQEINAGSQKNIGIDSLKNLIIALSEHKEQSKIGSLFSQLDQLINLQQKELDKLKTLKKALLDKLFV